MTFKAAKFTKKMASASAGEKLAVVMTGLAGNGFTVQLSPVYKRGSASSKSEIPHAFRVTVSGSSKRIRLGEEQFSVFINDLLTWVTSPGAVFTSRWGKPPHD